MAKNEKNQKDLNARKVISGTKPSVPKIVPPANTSPAMDEAALFLAKKLHEASEEKLKIVISGDFDVDGTSSAAIIFLFSKLMKIQSIVPYISKRTEGYGLTRGAINRLIEETQSPKETFVILMDFGISTTDEAAILLEKGFRVMVIDHHTPKPEARKEWTAIIKKYGAENIHVYDPVYCVDEEDKVFSCLSAAGLVYKLCFRILEEDHFEISQKIFDSPRVKIQHGASPQSLETIVNTMSKIAAIAQAADCMPFVIKGEVTPAWHISKDFETSAPLLAGVKLLYKKTNTASLIGWRIGPPLNAAGRLLDAYAAFLQLIESDEAAAEQRMKEMEEIRGKVQSMTRSARTSLEDDLRTCEGVAILVGNPEEVNPGIIGIAAGKATEKFKRPAFYLCEQKHPDTGELIYKASGRRGETDFSLEEYVLKLKSEGIIYAGGGHPAAAGISLYAHQLDRLIESAEKQKFEVLLPPFYEVTVSDAKEYLSDVLPTLPFGRGHESALLDVKVLLTNVRVLKRKIDDMVFAYILRVSDFESSEPLDIKIMSNDVDDSLKEKLELISKKNIKVPVSAKIFVYDDYKIGSSFPRAEYRLLALEEFDKDIAGTESGKRAQLKFLTKQEYESFGSDFSVVSLGTTEDGDEPSAEDILKSEETKVRIEIDWNEGVSHRNFILRRPSKASLEETLGLERLEAISDLHGGRYDAKIRGYVITYGVIKHILGDRSPDLIFSFSAAATEQWEKLKYELSMVEVKKGDTKAFEIPYLKNKEKWKPFGFQFADVKLYLDWNVALCNNDMGTGKTFEGAMWGVLRHLGASINENREIIIPENHKRRPVLVVSLKSVQGQFKAELESIIDLKATDVTSEKLRAFLLSSSEMGSADEKRKKEIEELFGDEDIDSKASAKKLKPIHSVTAKIKKKFYDEHIDGNAFVVSTYECLARNPWVVSSYEWGGVIIDEAHELKGATTHKTRAILGEQIDGAPLKQGSYTAPILALSGTFAKNRPADWFVWMRMTGADGGIYTGGRCGEALVRFDMRFDGLRWVEKRVRGGRLQTIAERGIPKNGEELKRIMAPFIVRRLKTEIAEIPSINVSVKRIPSSGLYLDVIGMLRGNAEIRDSSRELFNRYGLLGKNGELQSEKNSKKKSGDDDGYLDEYSVIDPGSLQGKLAMISSLDKAYGIVGTLRKEGWLTANAKGEIEPFVVMAFHQCAAKEISKQLEEIGIDHFLMMQNDSNVKREEKKSLFQAGEKTAFVTTFGTGGTGLNLTRAARMCIANLPWTDTALAQGRDRIFRIGQTRPTEVMILLQLASVDEGTYYLLQNKGRANFKTIGVDKLKEGEIPEWATGSVMDHAKVSSKNLSSPQRKARLDSTASSSPKDEIANSIAVKTNDKKGFKK